MDAASPKPYMCYGDFRPGSSPRQDKKISYDIYGFGLATALIRGQANFDVAFASITIS